LSGYELPATSKWHNVSGQLDAELKKFKNLVPFLLYFTLINLSKKLKDEFKK
jgi:hypothetical protein